MKKKYDVLISKGKMTEKPKNDIFQEEIHKKGNLDELREKLTPDQLLKRLGEGCSFVPGIWKKGTTQRREEFIEGKQIIPLDFDGYMTINEFVSRCKELGFSPNMIHTTSSHLKDKKKHKFRAIWLLDRPLDKETFKYNVETIGKIFGGFEKHKMVINEKTGKGQKVVVQEGIDSASKKYNQIMYGHCNKDKSALYTELFHYNQYVAQEVPEEVKKEIKKEKKEHTKKIKKLLTTKGTKEAFYNYPLHKEFLEGNKNIFGGQGTGSFPFFLEVGYNFASFDYLDEFFKALQQYDRKPGAFSSLCNRENKPSKELIKFLEKENTGEPKNNYGIEIKDGHYIMWKTQKDDFIEIQLSNFTIEILELIQGEDTEELTIKVINDDKRKLELIRTVGIHAFNSKNNLNNSIGFNVFFGRDTQLMKLKAYLLNKFHMNLKEGVNRITYKSGLYIGNQYCINSKGKKEEKYKLLEKYQAIRGTIETEDPITKEEIKAISEPLFNFNHHVKSKIILGWFGATFLKPLLDTKFPYLFLIGGPGSGKTSTIELFQNLTGSQGENQVSAQGTTRFTFSRSGASSEMIPFWVDEYKAHKLTEIQRNLLSSLLRDVYDNIPIRRGRADLTEVSYSFTAPLILTGETSIDETAIQDRSILIDFIKTEKREGYSHLIKHKGLLKKLGKRLLLEALKIDPKILNKKFKEMETNLKGEIHDDRERNNVAVVLLGLNFLCQELDFKIDVREIVNFIKESSQENHKTEIEKFLEVFNDLVEAQYIHSEKIYTFVGNELRIIWSAFYKELVKASKEGVISYDIVTNKELKKLIKMQSGVSDQVSTRFPNNKTPVKCLSIPYSN